MAKYGIPYQGSKSAIAEEIIASLPSGNRFVDLFGGGFSMSECALLSYKYKKVLYNDINPLLIPLIKDAIAGKYNYKNFVPEWVSYEEFNAKKDSDGFIKWVWSFGNDGNYYLYARSDEEERRRIHEWTIKGLPIPEYDDLECDIPCEPKNISARGKVIRKYLRKKGIDGRNNILERLERIQHLENLRQKENLEMTCKDYRDYEYQDGDIVYCDIPYQNGSNAHRAELNYQISFDFGAFYSWAISRPYPVYFSSYKLGGIVWERDKSTLMGRDTNDNFRREVLYCVDDEFKEPEKVYQGNLFERIM